MRPVKEIDKLIEDYEAYLLLEKGLANNTGLSYCNDVRHLAEFMISKGLNVDTLKAEYLHEFLALVHELGISPRSQARMLSGVKSFFNFLILEGYIEENPCEFIESP